MLWKGIFNSITTESACLAGKNNIKKWMSYEVIIMRFIRKKLIKSPSLSSNDDKRIIMADGMHTLAYGHTNLTQL